ncbi:hypothetical protein OG819_52375 [Streptomyces sp. NBC_01549]|uniref:hypothetical protein n=1 Tax=Streptomyces sp. NBC_01549 TaxID=2975874 RepID=UPI002259B978|nr:hypothetical protein [Streptomyces sp. NBC_01549]MCX4597826.1 hypothetical protein [Streptomyces sp. NBC_01549]
MDSTAPDAAPRGLDAFRRGWETQIGDDVFQLPAFSPDTIGDFRVKGNVAKVHGAAIADLHAASATRTADAPGGDQDLVAMYVVQRGAWTLGGPPGCGEQTVSAGQFLVRHVGRLTAFETTAHLTAKFLRRGARLRSGRVGLAGWLVVDYRMAARSETRPAMAW